MKVRSTKVFDAVQWKRGKGIKGVRKRFGRREVWTRNGGYQHVRHGDWLIKDGLAYVRVISPRFFKEMYEKA